MSERENIGQVESFRMEIQNIVDKIKERDATAAEIKDIKELDESDLLLWEKYKGILKLIDQFDSEKSDQQATEKFIADLFKLATELKEEVAASVKKMNQPRPVSKANFLDWMNNRNPFSALQAAKMMGWSPDNLKDILAEDIDLYLEG